MADFRKQEMAEEVSILYYENNWSQNEIAQSLGISRSYVSQLLRFAREKGIVSITINVESHRPRMVRREIELKKRFPKTKQFYIMSSDSWEFTTNNLPQFAAAYAHDFINESRVIGLNLGGSVEKTINSLQQYTFHNTHDKKVVQIMGGFYNDIDRAHPNELVKTLSSILGCEAYYLNCPVIVEQSDLRESLLKEKSIQSVVEMWGSIDLAIMGLGVTDERSKLFSLFNNHLKAEIKSQNAVSDVNANFFNEYGVYLPVLENNKISVSFEQLKQINRKVVICYGEFKKKAIIAALKAGMIDSLITDSLTIDAIEAYMNKTPSER